jgi:hypothetical protein
VLAAQDCQLVARDQDLDLFGVRRPPAEHQQLKAAQRQVDEYQTIRTSNGTTARDHAPKPC